MDKLRASLALASFLGIMLSLGLMINSGRILAGIIVGTVSALVLAYVIKAGPAQ